MNFITDNYIWFIIVGFVLLMITIGYYADKTKFGKRKLNDTVEPVTDSENDIEVILENNSVDIPVNELEIQSGIRETEVLEPFSDMVNIDNLNNTAGINVDSNNINNFEQPIDNNSAIPEINFIPSQENLSNGNLEPANSLETIETSDNTVLDNVNVTDDDIWKF